MARSILISVLLAIVSVIISSAQETYPPLPNFIVPPVQPSRANVGGSITLQCGINLSKLGKTPTVWPVIQWQTFTDEGYLVEIDTLAITNERIAMVEEHRPQANGDQYYGKSLFINNLDIWDERDYFCSIKIDSDEYMTPPLRLTVNRKSDIDNKLPDFIVQPEPRPVTIGEIALFDCGISLTGRGDNAKRTTTIAWKTFADNGTAIEINGKMIGRETVYTVESSIHPYSDGQAYYGKTLYVTNVQESDTKDEYYCTVHTRNRRYDTAIVKLELTLASYFELPQSPWEAVEGDDIDWTCSIRHRYILRQNSDCTHSYTVGWWRVTEDMNEHMPLTNEYSPSRIFVESAENADHLGTRLFIKHITHSDVGRYYCTVDCHGYEFGDMSTNIILNVKDKA